MSLDEDVAAVLHKIVDALGVMANKDALHAEIDSAGSEPPAPEPPATPEPAPDPTPEPEPDPAPLPEPDTPASIFQPAPPPFGTEDSPHAPV